jgi:hypothetical protein
MKDEAEDSCNDDFDHQSENCRETRLGYIEEE